MTFAKATTVSLSINARGFGFVMDGDKSVYVPAELLVDAGFIRDDFKIDGQVACLFESVRKGYRATRILQIGDKLSPIFCKETMFDSDASRGLVLKKLVIAGVGTEYRAYIKQEDGTTKLEFAALSAIEVRRVVGLVRQVANLKASGVKTNVPQKVEGKAKKAA